MSKYGIFCGSFGDDDAKWLESIEGLEAAVERMKKIATARPGEYFVFSPGMQQAIAAIDTSTKE